VPPHTSLSNPRTDLKDSSLRSFPSRLVLRNYRSFLNSFLPFPFLLASILQEVLCSRDAAFSELFTPLLLQAPLLRFSLFISNFINVDLLPLSLVSLVKDLSILFIFSKYHLFVSLVLCGFF
jgi:hypothetical protein